MKARQIITRTVLAAGAAGAVAVLGLSAAPAGAATAGPAAGAAACTPAGPYLDFVSPGTTPFFIGRPNNTVAGSLMILKPGQNGTTRILHCNVDGIQQFAFEVITSTGGRLFASSRDFQAGGTVTWQPGPGGDAAFASELWNWSGTGPYTFQNVKTGQFLRVRNHGPANYDTVTTGRAATSWNQS